MAEPENNLTIEELAVETGMTVRNIRSHRARGLLPAPEVRDRVGYYGPDHLARLRMIQELPALDSRARDFYFKRSRHRLMLAIARERRNRPRRRRLVSS